MKVKIATWNISCGIPTLWNVDAGISKEKDYHKFGLVDDIINTINAENIDIIGIQESVIFKDKKENSYAQIISEKTDLKFYAEFVVSDCHLLENSFIEEVILSKYPISNVQNIMFDNMNLSSKGKDGKVYKLFDDGFIISNIKVNDKTIKFITGHGPAFEVFDKTYEDYPHIYDVLNNRVQNAFKKDTSFIIVGDYNTENFLNMNPFIKENFNNLINGPTFHDGTAIDYILTSKNIKCISTKKIENKSDHLLCIADIEL